MWACACALIVRNYIGAMCMWQATSFAWNSTIALKSIETTKRFHFVNFLYYGIHIAHRWHERNRERKSVSEQLSKHLTTENWENHNNAICFGWMINGDASTGFWLCISFWLEISNVKSCTFEVSYKFETSSQRCYVRWWCWTSKW